jgi:XTP/dITP diphosphohydrolase
MPISLKNLVLATHNSGKLAEVKLLLAPLGLEVVSAGTLGLAEPVEDGGSFTANALIKARAAHKATGLPALADDSGLCITALDGAPGVETASWTKRGEAGLRELHDALGHNPDRSAQSVCVLALVLPDNTDHVFEGRIAGQFIWPPRGNGGFGYDSIFMPAGEHRTYAEMTREEKSACSHRRRAFDQLLSIWHK